MVNKSFVAKEIVKDDNDGHKYINRRNKCKEMCSIDRDVIIVIYVLVYLCVCV